MDEYFTTVNYLWMESLAVHAQGFVYGDVLNGRLVLQYMYQAFIRNLKRLACIQLPVIQ